MTNVMKITELEDKRASELMKEDISRYMKCQIVTDRYGRVFRVDENGNEIYALDWWRKKREPLPQPPASKAKT